MTGVEMQIIPREPESLQAKVDRLVKQRVAEIMARKEMSYLQPFFETPSLGKEMRRLERAIDWRKWQAFYDEWGCLACRGHETPHGSLGMCRVCFRRTSHRLQAIVRRLERSDARVDEIMNDERRAWIAYRGTAPPTPRKRLRDPAVPKWTHRPHLKPQMDPEQAGPRLRRLRELAGLSLRRLAKMAEVSPLTVLKFEQGKRQPLPQNCEAIKKALVEKLVEAFWPTPEGYR